MQIDPRILKRHYHEAAVEQLTVELQDQGYRVERDGPVGDVRADLVARKDDTILVYRFKVVGPEPEGWAAATARLHQAAHASRADFHLLLVRPPRWARIEVAGIEAALDHAVRKHIPPDLKDLAAQTRIESVADVEMESIDVRPDGITVRGEATVLVALHDEDGEACGDDTLPFTFTVVLDPAGRLKDVHALTVDLSSWFGREAATPAAGAMAG